MLLDRPQSVGDEHVDVVLDGGKASFGIVGSLGTWKLNGVLTGERMMGSLLLENHEREHAFGDAEVHLLSTIGAFIIALSVLVFMINFVISARRKVRTGSAGMNRLYAIETTPTTTGGTRAAGSNSGARRAR